MALLSGHHTIAIMAVLQELQGSYSSGFVHAYASAGTATITKGTLCVPVVDGSERFDLICKVERNPSTTDGSWSVGVMGGDVLVTTIQGGAWTEIPALTPIRWLSSAASLVELGSVSETPVSGGTSPSTPGALRQVVAYRDLVGANQAQQFWRASMGEFPAACVRWLTTTLADGSTGPSWGYQGGTRIARGNRLFADTFEIALVTTRLDSDYRRERDGELLRDSVLTLLSDRQVWRGIEVSRPSGAQILEARPMVTTPTSYIDVVRVAFQYVLTRSDGPAQGNPWLNTRYTLTKPTSGEDATSVDMIEPQQES
jgi:hypothetical protein